MKRSTIVFNAFVFCQIFNEFNARKLGNGEIYHDYTQYNSFIIYFNISELFITEKNMFSKLGRAPIFLAVFVITLFIQFLMVQFGGEAAKTRPLDIHEWTITVLIGSLSIPLGFISRFIPVPKDKDGSKKEVKEEMKGLLAEDNNVELDESLYPDIDRGI